MVICGGCQNSLPSNLKGFVSCIYTPKWEYQSKEFNRECDKFKVKCAMNTTNISKAIKVNTHKVNNLQTPVNVLRNQFNPFLCK